MALASRAGRQLGGQLSQLLPRIANPFSGASWWHVSFRAQLRSEALGAITAVSSHWCTNHNTTEVHTCMAGLV
jgi:hypothetical protein